MKIGLVLSGGGGKGAYELGVWKALKELGIDKYIEVFSGASIGAFNAVLFAQDDIDAAEELWDEVTMDKLVPIGKIELFKKGLELAIGGKYLNIAKKYMLQKLEEGTVPKDGAKEIIDKYLDVSKVKERNKICYAACTELPEFKAKYFKINDFNDEISKEMIVASASLPLIYDCTEILGNKYIDGGVSDNTPIKPVYEEGCDIIIVVLLSKEAGIDRSLYPNSKIIELAPKNLDESVIKGTLNLDEQSKRVRIREGYYDTMDLLQPIMLMSEFKFKKDEEEKYKKLFKTYNWVKNKFYNKENRKNSYRNNLEKDIEM
ncbi:patatin-like phospholipase family protein [Clostridium chauvoei]|uniref:Patatin-like phospholipase family protein n=2 Tax=Clostridium chauvoei TaxID=46867 RepID=A0ABD4RJ18_9CLOT|nr:patatin-like phospholipase family protein [Clostridium chauvoei]ATD54496.1 phospholipase [Clostridium chauvoei]ATD57821.1 phospholipase [Clostridium chauvoei]MBX7281044.1 patatin-like phospholipase family protein [Clostridium chauvoei]MBX7283569.1 patatin-like phospholipase family protein [Clostridium chauvoei]MBX7286017.1 patatin-like phospholipase family protein [Clostridium chauvoei]